VSGRTQPVREVTLSKLPTAVLPHRVGMSRDGDAGTDPPIGMGTADPEPVGPGESGTSGAVVCSTRHTAHRPASAKTAVCGSDVRPVGSSGSDPGRRQLGDGARNRDVREVCRQK
jgi:hypothetical protein